MYKSRLCRCLLEYNSACSFHPCLPHTKQAFTIIWSLKLWLTEDKSGTFLTAGPPSISLKRASNFRLTLGPFNTLLPWQLPLADWGCRVEVEMIRMNLKRWHYSSSCLTLISFFSILTLVSTKPFLFPVFLFFSVFIGALEGRYTQRTQLTTFS